MNLLIKTERKLLVMAKIQHKYDAPSALITALMHGDTLTPRVELFTSPLCTRRKDRKKKGKTEEPNVPS